jgi:hypothetical protein
MVKDMNITIARSKILTAQTIWAETLALTVILTAMGFGINDPFFLNHSFPWLILAPLLIGLRYGFLFGMSSTALFILLFIFGSYFNWVDMPVFPVESVVGMILVTMISAEFHDLWQRKLQPLQYKHQQLQSRMNYFSRTYHILKASHSQLEQQTANYTKSLRSSLLEIERHISTLEKEDDTSLNGMANHILNILSEYGSIQTASVYVVSKDKKIMLNPVGCLGNPPSLWPTNPLVTAALNTGYVTSIQMFDERIEHEILVVIPLIDIFQKIWGIVIINEMSLFAMQQNTLDLFSLLGGHIGDLIQRRSEAHCLSKDVWLNFEYELRRVLKEVLGFKADAALVISIFNDEESQSLLISRFRSELRGLDKVLTFKDTSGRYIIIKLLPLTDEKGLKSFLFRLGLTDTIDIETTDFKKNRFSLSEGDVSVYSWILNGTHSPEKVLSKITKLCQPDDAANSKKGDCYENISA